MRRFLAPSPCRATVAWWRSHRSAGCITGTNGRRPDPDCSATSPSRPGTRHTESLDSRPAKNSSPGCGGLSKKQPRPEGRMTRSAERAYSVLLDRTVTRLLQRPSSFRIRRDRLFGRDKSPTSAPVESLRITTDSFTRTARSGCSIPAPAARSARRRPLSSSAAVRR